MSQSLIAQTEYGQVRGVKKLTALDTNYLAFYGIPYAAPPTGDLRFKKPQPPKKWMDTLDATQEKLGCYAKDSLLKKVVGTEDCLNINIYTKDLRPSKPYPVMLYIFGGGFVSGSSSTDLYSPDFLLMSDVIVVIFNYRLGPFGFMSFKDKSLNVPGNAAFLDQLMAMRFVKNNIQNFGGDPNNVTLFGHSSGAVSTNWHCVSDQSKGFFNKAILLSGSVLNDLCLVPQSANFPLRLARKLGYEGGEADKDVLRFLQEADPVRVSELQNSIIKKEDNVYLAFGPHIEPYVTKDTFIDKAPIEMMKTSWGNDIDILIGCTSHEGFNNLTTLKADPTILENLTLESVLPSELNLSEDDPKRLELAAKLLKMYYPSSDPKKDETAYCKMNGDKLLVHNLQRLIESRQNAEVKGKTYFYRFAFDSPVHNLFRLKRNRPDVRGVLHADELSYYFKHNFGPMVERPSKEFTTIQRFVSVMTSFATNGDPNSNVNKADMQDVHWEPVEGTKPPFKCLNIDENLTFETFADADRLLLWDEMYTATNTPLY